ncbi:YifB family Mg chelatase-like AAA ATPase [Pseudaquabacterium rugosum]|uniref:YifB family Mg chelatase-like AAA ATPase n=1 Tax=Pseudaquabacterium rugosum TaxID=2984194 RepID=A0ABU9B9I3_9BURK
MSLALIHSRALDGLQAPPVQVEVHLANGLPSFTLVGLADTEVKEARERVRAALAACGHAFPHNKRVTVSLAPADLPKESGRFDLPIALGILAAEGLLDRARLDRCEFAGELSLGGALRPVRGALALALAAARDPAGRELVLPAACATRAARAQGIVVRAADDLAQVVQAMSPDCPSDDGSPGAPPDGLPRASAADGPPPALGPDLADVRGQASARRALEIAAAGQHHLLFVGPPGSGKSMLAQRLVGLLPPMDEDEALLSAALQGLEPGELQDSGGWARRPWRAPHHSASAVALVGGGAPPRPGEISLAHGGVLFLDELPEFPRSALEALREPMETGEIRIARAARSARYPAGFQLVAAMNPCPCGWLGARLAARGCRCTPDQIARYQGRLSGPLLDRIDLLVEVAALPPAQLLDGPPGEPSEAVRARVLQARARQQARQGGSNQVLQGQALDEACRLDAAARQLARQAAERLGWSARALHRALRVARTIADLAGQDTVDTGALAEALQYRRALPQAAN